MASARDIVESAYKLLGAPYRTWATPSPCGKGWPGRSPAPSHLKNVDACSVGYFQQQADDLGCGKFGWGTRAQLIKADYAL